MNSVKYLANDELREVVGGLRSSGHGYSYTYQNSGDGDHHLCHHKQDSLGGEYGYGGPVYGGASVYSLNHGAQ